MPLNIRLVVLQPEQLEPTTSAEFPNPAPLLLKSKNRRAGHKPKSSAQRSNCPWILDIPSVFFNLFVSKLNPCALSHDLHASRQLRHAPASFTTQQRLNGDQVNHLQAP